MKPNTVETPQYVRVSRAMPDLAHQLREQHDNQMNTMSTHHQSVLTENKQEHATASNNNRQEHMLTRNIILQNLQPFISILNDLSEYGSQFSYTVRLTRAFSWPIRVISAILRPALH